MYVSVVTPSRVNCVWCRLLWEMVKIGSSNALDGLPGLIQPKRTASQWWQVCLVWIKQGGSATKGAIQVSPCSLDVSYVALLLNRKSREHAWASESEGRLTRARRGLRTRASSDCASEMTGPGMKGVTVKLWKDPHGGASSLAIAAKRRDVMELASEGKYWVNPVSVCVTIRM